MTHCRIQIYIYYARCFCRGIPIHQRPMCRIFLRNRTKNRLLLNSILTRNALYHIHAFKPFNDDNTTYVIVTFMPLRHMRRMRLELDGTSFIVIIRNATVELSTTSAFPFLLDCESLIYLWTDLKKEIITIKVYT